HAGQRKRVADSHLSRRAAQQRRAHAQTVRRKDVALFAVRILQKRDTSGAVGVVFDRDNLGWDPGLVPLPIDDAVEPLGSAAAEAHGRPPLVVAAATALLQRLSKRLLRAALRDLRE